MILPSKQNFFSSQNMSPVLRYDSFFYAVTAFFKVVEFDTHNFELRLIAKIPRPLSWSQNCFRVRSVQSWGRSMGLMTGIRPLRRSVFQKGTLRQRSRNGAGFHLLGSLMVLTLLTACGASTPMSIPGINEQKSSESSNGTLGDLSDPSAVQNKAIQILANNCTSCHGAAAGPMGIFNLTNVDHLIQTGLIVPGNPDGSQLLQTIEANRMPKAGPLSAADKNVLRAWILGGAAAPTQPIVPTPPGPGPNPPPGVPVTGTLPEKAIAILTNNCFACHGTVANGGLNRINEPAFVISISTAAKSFISPGRAQDSLIYTASASGRMPIGGAKLSQADLDILLQWINEGAKAPSTPLPPPPPAIPLGPSFASLNANIFVPKCMGCHNATTSRGGVRMDSYSQVKSLIDDSRPTRTTLYDVTSSGQMPQSAPRLSTAEMQFLLQWISAGAPNN